MKEIEWKEKGREGRAAHLNWASHAVARGVALPRPDLWHGRSATLAGDGVRPCHSGSAAAPAYGRAMRLGASKSASFKKTTQCQI
jgi:hypothetical protein